MQSQNPTTQCNHTMQPHGALNMAAEIKRPHQQDVNQAHKKLVLESAKIAAENGRDRLLKNAPQQTQ